MGPGFKYHVVTVSSIFFALTVGLVYGSLFVSPRIANIADRQARLFANAQEKLQGDLKSKTQDLDHEEKALAALLPITLQGKLTDVPFAIIQTGDYPETVTRVHETLKQADARVQCVMEIGKNFDRPDEVVESDLATLHATDPQFPTNRAGLMNALATLLSHGADAPSTQKLLSPLDTENFVHTESGSDLTLPIRYVVLVAGSLEEHLNRFANVDQPLIRALQDKGITVLMCEPHDAQFSDIKSYQHLDPGVTTVDNVDTDLGRAALVFAIGGERGDYGIKPTATDILPPLPVKSGSP